MLITMIRYLHQDDNEDVAKQKRFVRVRSLIPNMENTSKKCHSYANKIKSGEWMSIIASLRP